MQRFPMQWSWRLALVLLPVLGLVALVAAGAELLGIVARGAWLGEAGDGERWAAVTFGVLVQPFGITALRHARLCIDDVGLHYLGFGFVCRTRTLPFAGLRRWGHAVGRNRGRREPLLLFERTGGSTVLVKLAMYTNQDQVRRLLAERLGPAAAASATMAGARFDQPV